MLAKKVIHETRAALKMMVEDSGRHVMDERFEKGTWFLQIKHEPYTLYLIHEDQSRFMTIIFSGRVDEETGALLTKIFNDPGSGMQKFFGLKSVINNPLCGYRTNNKDNIFMGYDIQKRIFPFEEEFTIDDLDGACQVVISVGVLGIDYLKVISGGLKMEQKIADALPQTSHEGMYQ